MHSNNSHAIVVTNKFAKTASLIQRYACKDATLNDGVKWKVSQSLYEGHSATFNRICYGSLYIDDTCISSIGLTRKNIFVTVLQFVLWLCSLFPTVEMLTLLLLQFLCNGNEQKQDSQSKSVKLQQKPVVQSKLLNHTRIEQVAWLMSIQHMRDLLLFLVVAVNFDLFQI